MHRSTPRPLAVCLSALLLIGAATVVAATAPAAADGAGERKKQMLAPVKRVVVVPFTFGTPTLHGGKPPTVEGSEPPANRPPLQTGPAMTRPRYEGFLRSLEARIRTQLPARLTDRTPYTVAAPADVDSAMKELNIENGALFLNGGLMKGTKFDLPNPAAVAKLAAALHADAVLLGSMDEPRKADGHYYLDLGGLGYESAHVMSKAGFFLLSADGTEILHDFVEVMHPLTRIGRRQFLLADWTDAEDQVVEEFLDEMTRYTPPLRRAQ